MDEELKPKRTRKAKAPAEPAAEPKVMPAEEPQTPAPRPSEMGGFRILNY